MNKKTLLLQGNEALIEGALAAGVRFFAGYPITPSTEVAELLAEKLPKVGGKFIQMEDEIASMAAVVGASLAGLKAMTATSGPGFSLKQENLGFASYTEVPCVIVDVQRAGPSTGMPTSPAQGDIMQARWGTHGDHPIIVLSPNSAQETYYLTIRAFDLAEAYRTPVILLLDEVTSHTRERVDLPDEVPQAPRSRKAPAVKPGEKYLPFEVTPDDVPPMASYGQGYHFHVTGLTHAEDGFPTNSPKEAAKLHDRLYRKIADHTDDICDAEQVLMDDAEVAIVTIGSTSRSSLRAVHAAREQGVKAGLFRPTTVWPFPEKLFVEHLPHLKRIIVPEMNFGQLILEVERITHGHCPVVGVNKVNGELITPQEIMGEVIAHE